MLNISEPVTIERISKDAERLLVELKEMRNAILETRAIMSRCIATARDVHKLLDELSLVIQSYATD